MTDHNESMRERIARAMIDADPSMSGYHETHIAAKMPYVDAVLTAIEEPTEGMNLAGAGVWLGGTVHGMSEEWNERMAATWRCMISAAKDGA